jgi:hypothetical protein
MISARLVVDGALVDYVDRHVLTERVLLPYRTTPIRIELSVLTTSR